SPLDSRQLRLQNPDLLLGIRVGDPEVETAATQSVAQFTGPVGGENHVGLVLGPDRPQLRDGHLKLPEHLQQERLKLLVRPVHLVDQKNRRRFLVGNRLQEGTAEQKGGAENLLFPLLGRRPAIFRETDMQHLLRIVPLVQRRVNIESFVALQPHLTGIQHRRQHLGDFRLAHAGGTLHQQGFAEGAHQVKSGHEGSIGDIALLAKGLLNGVNAIQHLPAPPSGHPGKEKAGTGTLSPHPTFPPSYSRTKPDDRTSPTTFATPGRYTPAPDGGGSRLRQTDRRSSLGPPPPGRPPRGSSPPSAVSPAAPAPRPPPDKRCRRRR